MSEDGAVGGRGNGNSDDNFDGLTEEEILQREEEELYGDDGDGPDVVPPSSDEDDIPPVRALLARAPGQRGIGRVRGVGRASIRSLALFDAVTPVDSVTATGPLGPGCPGPHGTRVHPCGYGTSGGLAVLGAPGLVGRTASGADEVGGKGLMAEADCTDVTAAFGMRSMGTVFLARGKRTSCK